MEENFRRSFITPFTVKKWVFLDALLSKSEFKRSARKKNTRPYSKVEQSQMILRDYLAQDRTKLANERTFLACLRTAITFSAAGGTLINIFPDQGFLRILGVVLLILGVCFGFLGGWRFVVVTKRLNRIDKKNKTPVQSK